MMSRRSLNEDEKSIYENAVKRRNEELELLKFDHETIARMLDKGLELEARRARKKHEDYIQDLNDRIQQAQFALADAQDKLQNGVEERMIGRALNDAAPGESCAVDTNFASEDSADTEENKED